MHIASECITTFGQMQLALSTEGILVHLCGCCITWTHVPLQQTLSKDFFLNVAADPYKVFEHDSVWESQFKF